MSAGVLRPKLSPFFFIKIGGGIVIGTCLLIDEDQYNTYTKLLLKYYLAEGVTNSHKIFLASADESPDKILTVSCLFIYIQILYKK